MKIAVQTSYSLSCIYTRFYEGFVSPGRIFLESVCPAPEPASQLKCATRDVRFLRSDSRCRQCLNVLSNVTPKVNGFGEKGRVSLKLTF